MPRHAHEDALSEAEFEQLVDGAKLLEPPLNLEALFTVFVAGRLGLRAGEIAHMTREWINYETEMIEIPRHSECECGYCRRQARREVEHDPSRSFERQLRQRWNPKTPAAARAVPFDYSERVKNVVLAFFEYYDEYPVGVNMVSSRLEAAAALGELLDRRLYPHCLRATAATHHAYNGLGVPALQAMMGWASVRTAQKYIRLTGSRTKQALQRVYN